MCDVTLINADADGFYRRTISVPVSLPYLPAFLGAYRPHRFDRGDVSFIILAGALVFLMVPGLGNAL